jgi:hypothetical protein
MAKNRGHSGLYLEQEFQAMRWLKGQGMAPEQIANATWGIVDEAKRTARVTVPARIYKYDRGKDELVYNEYQHTEEVSFKGEDVEKFFTKSGIFCSWMFTRERPRNWRKGKSTDAKFPLPEVEAAVLGVDEISINLLTEIEEFATMDLADLNLKLAKEEELETSIEWTGAKR